MQWTKFRKAHGWKVGLALAALLPIVFGLAIAATLRATCSEGPCPRPPTGPEGGAVEDTFYFANRSLTGDGTITARVASMNGTITYPPPRHDQIVSGLVPWAKAGIMIKRDIQPGSPYAAVMLTGKNGVRMQHNFTHDTAGTPGGFPRWLRLTRKGDLFTGHESTDGSRWSQVGTARLTGLPETVRIGLFVASPGDLTITAAGGGTFRFTQATGVFDQVSVEGRTSTGVWSRDEIGRGPDRTDWERYHRASGLTEKNGTLTVTGTGDIAPTGGLAIERTLIGEYLGLILVIIVAVRFPRGRRLVLGAAAFVAGLVAAAVTVPIGTILLRAGQIYLLPVDLLTHVRVIVGTGALFAVVAVFSHALGALIRRRVLAVAAALGVVLVPLVSAFLPMLPLEVGQWLLRSTPAAGFAIQQSVPAHEHVIDVYSPLAGYFPLSPWVGFGVMCAYTALAVVFAGRTSREVSAA